MLCFILCSSRRFCRKSHVLLLNYCAAHCGVPWSRGSFRVRVNPMPISPPNVCYSVDHACLLYYDWASPCILLTAQRKVPEIMIVLVHLWFGENYHYFGHLDSALSDSAVMNLTAPDCYSLVLVRVALSRASCRHPILLIKLQGGISPSSFWQGPMIPALRYCYSQPGDMQSSERSHLEGKKLWHYHSCSSTSLHECLAAKIQRPKKVTTR
jgi:hypothetical protein